MVALLLALQNVSEQLLPILGAVALIFVCILLKKGWQVMDSLNDTIKNLDPTLKLVDQSMEKVQAPLDTAVKYSHSLDKVHDKTSAVFGKVADFASRNTDTILEKAGAALEDTDEKKAGEDHE